MDVLDRVPSYHDFLHSYLSPNKPVIIGPALIELWPAFRIWVTGDGKINWDYLKATFGTSQVTVADCSTRDFSDQKRETMLFRDVVSLWQEGAGQSLYVKDWHLARSHPEPFYTTPDIFRDDWMNAYYSACTEDDFRFVYVGAAGTFTPLHRDVYTSYSWSTNVCGRKRWWLFPPDQTSLLLRGGGEEHLETAYDVRDVDSKLFPSFSHANPIVVEQESGQTIFVPSGWHHQVVNLTDCVSINHNWCNSVNLIPLYESMCAKVAEVERALEDVHELLSQSDREDRKGTEAQSCQPSTQSWKHEWVATVQDVVEKDAGWNWMTFWQMVLYALSLETKCSSSTTSNLWPQTPVELMPPLDMVQSRVRACYEDFVQRDDMHYVPRLRTVLDSVEAKLNG